MVYKKFLLFLLVSLLALFPLACKSSKTQNPGAESSGPDLTGLEKTTKPTVIEFYANW